MSFYRTDNPVADAERYAAEQEKALEKLPECYECGEHIQTEKCYEINGELICPDCLERNHERNVEDYTEVR